MRAIYKPKRLGHLAVSLTVLISSCASDDSARIAELEQENAELRAELEEAQAAPTTLATTTSLSPTTTITEASTTAAVATSTSLASSGEPVGPLTSPYVGGTEVPNIPAGTSGALEVVLLGSYDGTILPVVVRNRTDAMVTRIQVSATVRDGEAIITTGSDQGFSPNVVGVGEIAFGYLYFDGESFTDTAEIDMLPVAEEGLSEFENIRDLTVDTVTSSGDRLVGEAINEYPEVVEGPISVEAVCFDDEGNLLTHHSDFTDQETVESAGLLPFAIAIEQPCPQYLVTLSGFSS